VSLRSAGDVQTVDEIEARDGAFDQLLRVRVRRHHVLRQTYTHRQLLCGGYNYDSTAVRRPLHWFSKVINATVT